MRRREFITLLGGAAAWVSPARAQEPRKVIGILTSDFPNWLSEYGMPPFFQGLKDAGFVEGRNINFEIRQAADGHYDRLPSLAAELVGRDVATIFASDVPSALERPPSSRNTLNWHQ
jgi:putative ABC transport system substrate-binding protein